jgi:nucleotide-binding universal stress UspA family protein
MKLKPAPKSPGKVTPLARKRHITSAPAANRRNSAQGRLRSNHWSEVRANESHEVKQILVPIDFSDCSRSALQYAVTLARPLKANLVLLYVAETIPAGSEFGAKHLPDLKADLRRMAKKQFARFKADIPKEMGNQSVFRAGCADSEIIDVANSLKTDLIVMATHSKHTQQGQLGTTAGRVASLAPCPVLLVPVKQVCVPFFL